MGKTTVKRPAPSAPPVSAAFPELRVLREVRRDLARGGLTPIEKRTAAEQARIVVFRAVSETLALIDRFQRRLDRGESCRLVEREHAWESGRLVIEIVIEDVGAP